MIKIKSIVSTLALGFLGATSFATDISKIPLNIQGSAPPNVIFGMDDSGSMDFEVLLNTSDGAFWWDTTKSSGWSTDGVPLFNDSGATQNEYKLAYLFPNGCSSSTRMLCDSSGHYAIMPTYQLAFLRSKSYNPQYYDSSLSYAPWPNATISGVVKSFIAQTATSALSHPLYTTSQDLTSSVIATGSNQTFTAFKGMVVPAGAKIYFNNNWVTLGSAITVGSGNYTRTSYSVAMSYYIPTFWNKESCSVDNVTCTRAPDGSTLKRYEIKNGVTFPSGRTYTAEMQNFANWFTFYRKRKLSLAASMGTLLPTLSGLKLGVVAFNNQKAVTMLSTDNTDPTQNALAVSGLFYGNASNGGTPTKETLNYIGNQFATNKNVITASCQKNAAFIVTDGFGYANTVTPPSYNSNTYGKGKPYQTTYSGSISDIALSYYTNQLRTDLPSGRVPAASTSSLDPSADKNSNLHMNTFAITLGAKGYLWPTTTNPYVSAPTWVNYTANASPNAVDDLWHATINGRGQMYLSSAPEETAKSIQAGLNVLLQTAGSQSSVSYNTINFSTVTPYAYLTSYNMQGWTGDVLGYEVDSTTGALKVPYLWSASSVLNSTNWTTRKFVTYTGKGVVFNNANIGASVNNGYSNSSLNVINYLRGDRSLEGSSFRLRSGLMGAVVNAKTITTPDKGYVIAATGEGGVHVLNTTDGKELWTYIPGFNLTTIGQQTQSNWTFQTLLDGSPSIQKIGKNQVLLGTAGAAGIGAYALNVSNIDATESELSVASRIMWEFPNNNTPGNIKAAYGTNMTPPVAVSTSKYGSVVLMTSGYNVPTPDKKGRLFVLNALDGSVLATLETADTDVLNPGLGSLSAFQEQNGITRFVYAGDERGNLWKFDLETSTVTLLTQTISKDGAIQPITSAPELAYLNGKRMVFVGTGRFYGESDFTDAVTHSFYGLWDNGNTLTRNQLAPRTVQSSNGYRYVTGNAISWTSQKGWVTDIPTGEKANMDSSLGPGFIAFTTNQPSKVACSASSVLYLADPYSGLTLGASAFINSSAYYGVELGSTLTTKATVTRLSNQKIGITTRQSDGSVAVRQLNVDQSQPPSKKAWKEVAR